ncbi:MAG TPA: O-antigen ligase family protein [Gaiellaceae bacterium]|nr:O-antigen ligase family protein [Gaiellaceae bacterium]
MRGAAVRGALAPGAAAALCFASLFLSAGSSQSRIFWIGTAAVLVAATGWALQPPTLPRPALVFFLVFAALVLWQAASIAWSIQPARSWDYANRSLVYLAFAAVGALLGGLAPRKLAYGAAALLGALFLWALTAKVVPALYSDYGRLARLRYPLGYWNELALLAASSVPIGLWLARRLRLAGGLLLYTALVVVVITYSRVGILLSVLVAVVYLVLDDRRLETVGVLAVAWIAGGAVAGIALLLPGVADDGQPHSVRVHDGLLFGLAFVVGAAAVALALRHLVKRAVDARVVRVVAVGLAAVAVAVLAVSVLRAGGLVQWTQDRWDEFANPVSAQVGQTPGRLASASSSNRWRWWQEAWNAFVDHPANGTGAGTFGLTDRIERTSSLAVVEPHSTPLQFLSELGLIGFLLYGALLVALARRTFLPLGLAIAVCFLHSFVDIDWDYIAVQGPLFLLIGALLAGPPRARSGWLVPLAAAVCALAAVYSLASPWLSERRLNSAFDAAAGGNLLGALDRAQSARRFNPLAVEPLWLEAALTADKSRALAAYRQARDLEPLNPDTWYQLGAFELHQLRRPRAAYYALNRAYTLDNFLFGKGTTPGRDLDRARCEIDPSTCPG